MDTIHRILPTSLGLPSKKSRSDFQSPAIRRPMTFCIFWEVNPPDQMSAPSDLTDLGMRSLAASFPLFFSYCAGFHFASSNRSQITFGAENSILYALFRSVALSEDFLACSVPNVESKSLM